MAWWCVGSVWSAAYSVTVDQPDATSLRTMRQHGEQRLFEQQLDGWRRVVGCAKAS